MECSRSMRLRDTLIETPHNVMNYLANPLGILHGGNHIRLLVDSASIAASRVARGYSVLARIDYLFLLEPVRAGENLYVYSWVDYVGRASMEVSCVSEAEDTVRGERRLVSVSAMTLVAIDPRLRPRPVGVCIEAPTREEELLLEEALRRRRERDLAGRREAVRDLDPPRPLIPGFSLASYRLINPGDSIAYGILHAGSLLFSLDELAGIVAGRYARGVVVTSSLDSANFYSPGYVGEVLEMFSAITYVGGKVVEVEVKAIARDPLSWGGRHITTARLVMVNLGAEGRPVEVKPYHPRGPEEELAIARARERIEALASLRSKVEARYSVVLEGLRRLL